MKEHKRGNRRQKTLNAIERQKKIGQLCGIPPRKGQLHRYAKHHATNCGIPRCVCCGNPRRVFGQRTFQEIKNLQTEE